MASFTELAAQVALLEQENAVLRTRLVRAEEQAQQTHQLLQTIIDAIPQLILWKDRHSVFQGCNQRMAEKCGFDSPAAITGKTDYDTSATRAEADAYRRQDREVMETNRAQWHIIETLRQPDGSQAWLDTSKIPLHDAAGQVVGIAVVIEEITERKRRETEQQMLLALLENSRDFIALADCQGNLIYLNPSGRHLVGLQGECEAGSQSLVNCLPPEEQTRFAALVHSIAASNAHWQGEWQLQNIQTGERIEVEMTLFCLEGASGDRYLASVSRDIRERKQTERAIQEANIRFQSIAASIPGTLFQYRQTPDNLLGYFTYLSAGCRKLFELEPKVALQHQELLWQRVHPDDLLGLKTAVLSAWQTGLDWSYQYRLLLSSERVKWVQASGRICRNCDGTATWDGVMFDVTEHEQAVAKLFESKQRLKWLFEQSPLGTIEWTRDFRIVDWNQAATTLFGYTKAEAVGKNFIELEIVPEDVLPTLEPMVKRLAAGEGSVFSINDNLSRDGRRFTCEWHNVPLRNEQGEFIGLLSQVQDVTEREQAKRQLEQQKSELEAALQQLQQTQLTLIQSEKMSSLGQLVAGVAHEINNPVNFIYANLAPAADYVEQLLALVTAYRQQFPEPGEAIEALIDEIDLDFLVDDIKKLLGSMRVGAERIREIVRSLRIFSRVDEAEYKEVDLHTAIDSTLTILEHRLKARPGCLAIEVVRDYGQLPLVECHAGQLNQVFMNVLANAIDALEERDAGRSINEMHVQPSQIVVRTRVLDGRASISIADNGIGMTPEVRERIFNPFFTTKPTGKGTGLGLSLSYQIVTDKHGGRLYCQSEPGQGCEVTIEIPLRQPKEKAESAR